MKNDKQFIGCYAKDKLPKKLSKLYPKKVVINTSSSMNRGEHWVAMILFKTTCFYFDSFGLGIMDQEMLDFLIKLNYKSYIYNNKCIQHFKSEKCGQFCIKFLKNVHSRKSYHEFLQKFNYYDLKKNDTIVKKIKT